MKFGRVVIAFVVILSLFAAYTYVTKTGYDRTVRDLRNRLIEADSLKEVQVGIYAKLAKESTAREVLQQAQNKELAQLAKKQNEIITGYQNIVMQQSQIIFSMQQGVITEDSTGKTVHMNGRVAPYTIKDGWANCSSGLWGMKIDRDPINLELMLTRTRLGDISKVYGATNDSTLEITKIGFTVVPESKKFWRNLALEAGVYYSKKNGPGLVGGLGFGRWTAGTILQEGTIGLYGTRKF